MNQGGDNRNGFKNVSMGPRGMTPREGSDSDQIAAGKTRNLGARPECNGGRIKNRFEQKTRTQSDKEI